jgi:hypothetical protein
MNTTPTLRQQLRTVISEQAWTESTVIDLVEDFLDAHPTDGAALVTYFQTRADDEECGEDNMDGEDGDPEPAPPGQSVEDLDRIYGLIPTATGDLLTYNDVKYTPAEVVWTIVSGDDGSQWAEAGFHVVNRLGYRLTQRPWTTGTEFFRYDD